MESEEPVHRLDATSDLTEQGHAEAKAAGQKLKARGLKFDIAFTSALDPGAENAASACSAPSATKRSARPSGTRRLNERDYGDLSGLNKD